MGNLVKWMGITNLKRGVSYIRANGVNRLYVKVTERMLRDTQEKNYTEWFLKSRPTAEELEKQRQWKFSQRPLISVVVPAYRTPEVFLREMIDSVCAQSYQNFELCIADGSGSDPSVSVIVKEYQEKDQRILYQKLSDNKGISENTNAALKMASGEYIALLDHDDLLAPNALFEIAKVIDSKPDADVIYTDEDKVTYDLKQHFHPHFKPHFNLELLQTNNYICHFFVVKKSIADSIGGFRSEFDGSQDYDFILRCVMQAKQVYHVARVLYHWRSHRDSTAENPGSKLYAYQAGKRALETHLGDQQIGAEVSMKEDPGFYKVTYSVSDKPKVIIFVSCRRYLKQIERMTAYDNYELIYQSRDLQKKSDGEYILFLDGSLIPQNPDWLENLLGPCMQPQVAAAGGLVHHNKRIIHAGMALDEEVIKRDLFYGLLKGRTGYMHRAALQQYVTAVSGRCLLIKREVFQACGGLDKALKQGYWDLDLCLNAYITGFKTVFTPYAVFKTDRPEHDRSIYKKEAAHFREKWRFLLEQGDIYQSGHLMARIAGYRRNGTKDKKNKK